MRTISQTGFPPTCPVCGGSMVAEFYGNYGAIYKITKEGRLANTKPKKVLYAIDSGYCDVYCSACGRGWEESDKE